MATSRRRGASVRAGSARVRTVAVAAILLLPPAASAQVPATGDPNATAGLPPAVGVPIPDVSPAPHAGPPAAPNGAPAEGPQSTPLAAPPGAPVPGSEVPNAGAARDVLSRPAYIPGYRLDRTLGLSPNVPRVGGLPGGMTPGYAAPMPATQWTFRWTGFLTASLQTSSNQRVQPAPGQSQLVFHTPPQTIDEYGSFVGTSTVPGQWAQLNFVYGNRYVSANLSITTWNPTDPTTFYQIGSQQFVNNFYLAYSPAPIGPVHLHALAGYFYNGYGAVGQSGLGIYTSPLVGGVHGVGEDLFAEYYVDDDTTVTAEDGIMGNRNGMGAINIVPSPQNGASPQVFPSAWVHHLHVGIETRGQLTLRARLHLLSNWAQDDRVQVAVDNQQTRQIDESYVKDGRITVYGADAAIASSLWGYVGAAASYTHGSNAYPVTGLNTFGGDGQSLTNRWWGQNSGGTGDLVAAGINYSASIGQIVSFPVAFNADGPDLTLNTGLIFAESWTQFQPFEARARFKYGADLLYTFLPFMGVGFRADVVVPNSHDAEETFVVVAPRLVFKSDWSSRDTVTLQYGKWFYGPHTHPEASSVTPGDRLDDQLFALNAQMYW
jgi:hypothetical protein